MTYCVARPRTAIAEPVGFPEFTNFTNFPKLANFTELDEFIEKDKTHGIL